MKLKKMLASIIATAMSLCSMGLTVFAEDSASVAKVNDVECADAVAMVSALNSASGDVTVEIYGKLESGGFGINNSNITKLSFIGKDTDAEICVDGVSYIDVRYTNYPIEYTELILSHTNAGQNIDGFLPQYFSTYNGANVIYTNCTFPDGVTACGSVAGTTYEFTNCTFNNLTSGLYSLWISGNSTNVVVNGGKFCGVRGIKLYSEGSDDFSSLTVSEATFCDTITEKCAVVLTKGESVTLTNNTFNNTTGTVQVDDDYASSIEGKTVTIDGREYVVDSENLTLEETTPAGLSGEGTEEEPYLINNIEDFKWFRDDVNNGNNYDNQYIKLTADIELGSENWTPIGNSTNKFLGTFDGDNKNIKDLVVNVDTNNAGLFGFASVVKNVKLENVNVNGIICVGALVGELESSVGTVDNCHVSGIIKITGENSVGGLAGKGYANIKNSSVDGSNAGTSFVQGVAGSTEEGDNVGGIIGHLGEGNTLGVANSTAKNITVKGTRKVGGIVGTTARANDCVGNTVNGLTIECTATKEYADDNASTATIGGIVGNYFGSATSGGILTGSTVTNTNFVIGYAKSAGALAGGDRVNNGGAPVGVEAADNTVANVSGATNDYFVEKPTVAKIGDVKYGTLQEALNAAVTAKADVTVTILDDIDLNGVDWEPVVVDGYTAGAGLITVEGNEKTITGLNDMLFYSTWAGKSGLIIKDLTIADSTIVHDENDENGNVGVGAFIGYPQASETITLSNCHLVNSTVKGGHWTGGLIGMAGGYNGNDGPVFMNLTVENCSVTDSIITGKGSVGGIIGHGSCAAWTNVEIKDVTVTGNTITSTGDSNEKAGSICGTVGAAGQATTADGETKTGGMSVDANVSKNTVTSNGTKITTIYGRQGTATGTLEITGGIYDANPLSETHSWAGVKEGYELKESADGTYSVVANEEPTMLDKLLVVYNMNTKTQDEVVYYPIHIYAGIDSLKYSEVGFKVTAKDTDTEKSIEKSTTTVYRTMSVTESSGETTIYSASQLGGNYMFGHELLFTASDWKNEDTNIWITPYAKTLDGKVIDGTTKQISDTIIKEKLNANSALFKEEK